METSQGKISFIGSDETNLVVCNSVMADYEKEIASPLKNAIFGEMSRLLLIQVQKQKGSNFHYFEVRLFR
jgi:hypothetical protein